MKLGIMQPYFFPYAQQFRHIYQCDLWVVFDTPKFSRKSWVSRNRIVNQNTEWSYISIPIVKGASQSSISQARILDVNWRKEFCDNLRIYENKAPYYNETMDMVEKCISNNYNSIADLNTSVLKTICSYLNIKTEIRKLSEMSLEIPSSAKPGEWACHITRALGADIYSNAPGGKYLFDPKYYEQNNITLEFYSPCPLEYLTPGFSFVPDLSVIDSLMWIGRKNLQSWCSLS